MRGLSQKDAAKMSGVGEKSISSFETGERIDSLKISQLLKLLKVYGVSEEEFFGTPVEEEADVWAEHEDPMTRHRQQLGLRMEQLPSSIQSALLSKLQLMIETAEEVQSIATKARPYAGEHIEWQMLNSRN